MPTQEADRLLDTLLAERDLQRQVLEETIESAESGTPKESGRTICSGSTVKSPLNRFERAVELQECPDGTVGIIHCHTSMEQLRYPEHSLPDTANVLFKGVDVSIIVGVREFDVMLAPQDIEQAKMDFRDALGLEVNSTKDVARALDDGSIRDFEGARARVRRRLMPLYEVIESPFDNLDRRVTQLHGDGMIAPHEPVTARSHSEVTEQCRSIRERMQRNEKAVSELIESAIVSKIPPYSLF